VHRGEVLTELDDEIAFPVDELVLVHGTTAAEVPPACSHLYQPRAREARRTGDIGDEWTRLV